MTEQNPYQGGDYQWGPPQQQPPYGGPGYGYPAPVPGYGPPAPVPGYGFPGPPMGGGLAAPMGGAPVFAIGDITVVGEQIITPAGTLPLRGAIWNATDMSHTEERIPTHAVVLAVIFFVFCLLGLLFLLMKEKQTTGFIQITVTSAGRHHSTMVPAIGPGSFPAVMAQINYARSLSM